MFLSHFNKVIVSFGIRSIDIIFMLFAKCQIMKFLIVNLKLLFGLVFLIMIFFNIGIL